eukprot:TRINITY_DN16188_c0_g1_i2.p1 TRINITY_DN16188_c0_g1~~TRINITY_DN16188_c0_g1_i2.p1  ORF type:complete len:195 (-),score=1.58 TRINITY_DN16188_c0_g1_i2:557-1141(-)
MHAPNLLKVVLKPRSSTTDSAPGQSTSSGTGGTAKPSAMSRSASESTLDSIAKGAAAPPRMICLCAPTTHAGSFRCRLHRASQTQWPTPASSTPSTGSQHATSAGGIDIPDPERRTRPQKKRSPMLERSPSFSPPRSPDGHPSRLSKVVVAGDNDVAGYKKVSSSSSEGPVRISKFLSSNSSTTSSVVTGMMVM